MERVVIVGGGLAAASAAKTLRAEGFGGGIAIYSEERHHIYDRPPLSKAVLQGAASAESTCLLSAEMVRDLRIDLMLGERIVQIDRSRQSVILSSREVAPYDSLLIATGSRPRKLSAHFVNKTNVVYLRTLDDADRLRSHMGPGKHLLSIGAGWIGLEVAATARKMGMNTNVVELSDRLCGRSLPPDVGEALAKVHRDNGTVLHLKTTIDEVFGGERVESVKLSSGDLIPVDIVVVGVGAIANDDLAEAAGLETNAGVLVDERLRTSDNLIYAAGDVAAMRSNDGLPKRQESWANAQDQGAAAARSILGNNTPYVANTWFWSDQYDLNVQMIGDNQPESGVVLRRLGEGRTFTRLSVADGRIVGAICFGMPREMAIVRRLMAKGYAVDNEALVIEPDLRKLL